MPKKHADHAQPFAQYRGHFFKLLKHNCNFSSINHFNSILIHQSNKTVTVISVIYTITNLVSVWDPTAHLKQVKDCIFIKKEEPDDNYQIVETCRPCNILK